MLCDRSFGFVAAGLYAKKAGKFCFPTYSKSSNAGDKRIFGPVMHFDDGKIWIQYNGTEESVAERLVEMGVPTHDIVIGFHSSFKRQFTRYAA